MGLGELAQQEGALPLARAAYRVAAELDEKNGEAAARLGYVLFEEGRDQEAVASIARAKSLGADAALLDLTWAMMRFHVDWVGPFPRFSAAGSANPASAPTQTSTSGTAPHVVGEGRSAVGIHDRGVAPPDGIPQDGVFDRRGRGLADGHKADDAESDAEGEAGTVPGQAGRSVRDEDDEEIVTDRGEVTDGLCEVVLTRQGDSGIFVVDALVQGHEARLIVDTGASLTVLARDFVEAAGLHLEEEGSLTARTAGGARTFRTATVSALEVGGRSVEELRIAICDECGMPGSDGLLGLDVQEPLGISLFPGLGILRFEGCTTQGDSAE